MRTGEELGTAKSKAAIQTVLGGAVQNAARSLADRTIISMELESGASSAAIGDREEIPEAALSLFLSGRPPWSGAVPDMSKLAASTQMDTRGLWWGWDCPEDLRKFLGIVWRDWVPRSKCDFCVYEAAGCYLNVYYCRLHEGLVI